MKYLIIGLGNPGAEYENTRHNIGFKVLDKLAGLSNISFSKEKLADIAEVKFKGRNLVLVKPNTFMNLSGKAVAYWMQKSKINIENGYIKKPNTYGLGVHFDEKIISQFPYKEKINTMISTEENDIKLV